YFERVQALEATAASTHSNDKATSPNSPAEETTSLLQLTRAELPPLAQEMIGGYLHLAELLGRRVGELHVALAKADGTIAFAPEPFSRLYQRGLYQSMRNQLRTSLDILHSRRHRLSESVQQHANQLLQLEGALAQQFSALTKNGVFQAERIRCHGDLHL